MPNTPTPKIISKKHLARIEKERIQRRNLLIGSAIVLVLVFGLVGYGLLDQYVLKMIRPVATVNGKAISISDWQAEVRFSRWQAINQYQSQFQYYQYFASNPQFAAQFQQNLTSTASQLNDTVGFGNSTLDKMIEDILIKDEAQKLKVSVTSADVDKFFQDNFGYFPNGTPTTVPSATLAVTSTFSPTQLALVTLTPTSTSTQAPTATQNVTQTPTLPSPTQPGPTATITPTSGPTATATPFTAEGYKKVYTDFLAQLKPINVTEAQVRAAITANLLRQKVSDSITADIKASQEEVWARHILVKDEATAKTVEDRLKKGEDFAKVAKEVSTDTGSAPNGGDLGWFPRGQMVAEFEKAAFSLKVGEISQPIKSSFGYHIIQVLGHDNRPVDASTLQQQKTTKFTTWLADAQKAVKITRNSDLTELVPVSPTIPPNMILPDATAIAPQQPPLSVPTEAVTVAAPTQPASNAAPSATPKP